MRTVYIHNQTVFVLTVKKVNWSSNDKKYGEPLWLAIEEGMCTDNYWTLSEILSLPNVKPMKSTDLAIKAIS